MPVLIAKSIKDVADTIGVNPRKFSDWLREGCPGEPRHYNILEAINWAREYKWGTSNRFLKGKLGKNKRGVSNDAPDDELIAAAGDDDLARRLIEERVENLIRDRKLKDFKIEEREDSLLDRENVVMFLNEVSDEIRKAQEVVEKSHGAGACDPLRRVMERMASRLEGGALDG